MNERNINYNYQYRKWHDNTDASIKYDIDENIKLLDSHNIYPLNKESKVLELGCATGCLIQALQIKGFANILGVDIDKDLYEIAKSKNLNVLNFDAIEFLSQNKEKYDVIYCFDVLEHIDKPQQIPFLSLINATLTENGFFVLKIPNALTPLEAYFRYNDFTHTISYTTDSLSFLLMNSGFSDFVFRPQHLEDEELRMAKHNYAFMLYKQFGLEKQILTPNILAVVFKNSDDRELYEKNALQMFNDYREKEKIENRYDLDVNVSKIIIEAIGDYYLHKSLYKIFDFLNFISLGIIPIFGDKKLKYKKLCEFEYFCKNKQQKC